MLKFLFFILAITFSCPNAKADVPPELQSFDFLENVLPKDEFGSVPSLNKTKLNKRMEKNIIPLIEEAVPESAIYNLQNAEQVFCYHVEKRPQSYKGYTLSNYKITDYCGELNFDVLTTTYEALFTRSPNIIATRSNCKIEPKVMLRFIRGIDSVDVLLSSPCPSFTIFYAGRYKSFNIKQGIIDDIISQFEKPRTEFMSPSLVKQTVPIANIENADDSYKIEKNKKELEEINDKENLPDTTTKPQKSGWGNLKLKM